MKQLLGLAALVLASYISFANISLPKIFGDHMVLQRNQPIPVWGWAAPNEKIVVSFNKQTKTTKTDKTGKWTLRLDPEMAGGPYQLTIKGKNEIHLEDILVGEVWVCSGQSNMEMPIAGWGKINQYEQEIAAADYPQIRHFKVPNTVSATPASDIPGGAWKICNPGNAGDFTATGYFFARALYQALKIPVGLVNTSWGGTHSETWTSKAALAQSDAFKDIAAAMDNANPAADGKEKMKLLLQKIESIQGPLENAAATEKWKEPAFDDSHWQHLLLPGLWEAQGYADLDGLAWFRKTIEIAPEDAGKQAVLELAMIDDMDETYINGVKIGGMNNWDEERKYTIPAGLLKAGKNTISIRVTDNGGGGGVYGDAANMKLRIGNNVQSLAGDWLFRIAAVLTSATGSGPNSAPSLLFNGMLNPLIPFAIKGVIWYQGESNAGRAYQYRTEFPLMITDWRQHWNQGDFPFLFVQLASFNAGNGNSSTGSSWAELREAQSMTLSLPNTGMAVTTDIGNAKDIHPKNKQDVGKRLASIALNKVYGQSNMFSGPVYTSMQQQGSKIVISFSNTGKGLMVKDKYGYLRGFEIAGADQVFHYAKAMLDGDRIVVFQEGVETPVAVRYNWADFADEGNLFNKDGFPAPPFRTDNWKGITEKEKYVLGE